MAKGRNKRSPGTPPATAPAPSAQRTMPPATRRFVRILLAVVGIFAVLLGGWYLWVWCTAPAPPVVAYTDADPLVVQTLEDARRDAWWHPHSAAAWGRLGQLLAAHGYKGPSNRALAEAQRLAPDNPRWPYLQGYNLLTDDPATAVRYLKEAVAMCGSKPDGPRLTLAEAYLQQGQWEEARQEYGEVVRSNPDNARAHLGLGRLALERSQLREALPHLERAAANPLTRKASGLLLAQVQHQMGDRAAADRERSRVAELPSDPLWPDPYLEEVQSLMIGKQARLSRLQTLHRQGRHDEARSLARQLENEYPDVYWHVEGRGQMVKRDFASAERALRKAIKLAPESIDAQFDLGTALFEQKDYAGAAECYRKVTELEPGYGPAHLRLGHCWAKQGNREDALRAFQAAVRYAPQSAEARRDLGEALAQQGRTTEAIAELRQALQLRQGDRQIEQLLEVVMKQAEDKQ